MPAWKSQVWARDRQDVNIDGHEKARKTPLLVITARREPLGLERLDLSSSTSLSTGGSNDEGGNPGVLSEFLRIFTRTTVSRFCTGSI